MIIHRKYAPPVTLPPGPLGDPMIGHVRLVPFFRHDHSLKEKRLKEERLEEDRLEEDRLKEDRVK